MPSTIPTTSPGRSFRTWNTGRRFCCPSPSGKVKVLIPAEQVGSMLWPIFMGTGGRNVAKGDSPLRDKLGRRVFDPGLTIIDDPHLDYCHSCGEVDGDGVPARKTTIFERGVLKTFLYDWDTAHLAGTSPTGHNGCWPWSTYIAQGTLPEQELLAGIDDGLIIKSLMGFGQGNIINGDFSCNVALGYRVKNGHIAGRVKNTMVAGNLYELLSRNVRVGRDSDPMHRHPAMVLDGVIVAVTHSPVTLFRDCCSSGACTTAPSHPADELERAVVPAGQALVAEVRVDHHVLLRGDLVVGGELRGGRADRVHQARGHQHLAADARGQVLAIDVAQPAEHSSSQACVGSKWRKKVLSSS